MTQSRMAQPSHELVIDGTAVELVPGSAPAVTPKATRSFRAAGDGCAFVAICA
jgi:hypothetical protein